MTVSAFFDRFSNSLACVVYSTLHPQKNTRRLAACAPNNCQCHSEVCLRNLILHAYDEYGTTLSVIIEDSTAVKPWRSPRWNESSVNCSSFSSHVTSSKDSGQIMIIPNPELRPFLGIYPTPSRIQRVDDEKASWQLQPLLASGLSSDAKCFKFQQSAMAHAFFRGTERSVH